MALSDSEREAKLQKLAELEGFDTVEAMFDAAVLTRCAREFVSTRAATTRPRWHPINGRVTAIIAERRR